MNKRCFTIFWILSVILSACSPKLASVAGKTKQPIDTNYQVLKDVAYGIDKAQVMDIYLSEDAKKWKRKNFTLVFIHGGGYYVGDKSEEEKFIEPYLEKGMNVVNINYRLKRGIPVATEDLTTALNFLLSNSATYGLNLDKLILTGFSAGAHIASNVAVSINNPEYPNKLADELKVAAVINFSGPVDKLDLVEKVFINNDVPIMKDIGNALFPNNEGYTPKDTIRKYEPITYFDKHDPPFFLWHGGKDDQVPPSTFSRFVDLLNEDRTKNKVVFVPAGFHDTNAQELGSVYTKIFAFLDKLH